MNLLKEIAFLIRKELILEWRQKYAIGGIFLYVLATLFVVYISFIKVQAQVWNVLFWIIILFASVNAVTKSFVQENSDRQMYYYLIANPTAVILSKIIYNSLLLLGLSLLSYAVFGLIIGNPVQDNGKFILALVLGSIGFSVTFTFISAIASKANNSATLMVILSFPIVLPILMTLIRLSANALRLIQDSAWWKEVVTLVTIDALLIALIFILFPYLWKD